MRTAFLVFPLRIPAPDSLAAIDIVGPLFEQRAAVSQTSTQAEVCLRPHRWNFPSKKLPFRACVLAFELIGTGGAPRTAAEVTTNIVVGVCDGGDATVSPLRDKEGR